MSRITIILATVLSLAFTPLAAQDFSKGSDAFDAGDYATALQEWTPLAEAGDASAHKQRCPRYQSPLNTVQER